MVIENRGFATFTPGEHGQLLIFSLDFTPTGHSVFIDFRKIKNPMPTNCLVFNLVKNNLLKNLLVKNTSNVVLKMFANLIILGN